MGVLLFLLLLPLPLPLPLPCLRYRNRFSMLLLFLCTTSRCYHFSLGNIVLPATMYEPERETEDAGVSERARERVCVVGGGRERDVRQTTRQEKIWRRI